MTRSSPPTFADRGVYTLILTSVLFQLCLYSIKKYRYSIKSIKTRYSVNKCRLRNYNYICHLQKTIVDKVTIVCGILFIATISLAYVSFGLYRAWRLNRNSENSAEERYPTVLAPGIFFFLALLFSGTLIPYFTSHALRCLYFSELTHNSRPITHS